MNELVAVGPTSVELFVAGAVVRVRDLSPASDFVREGVSFRTLDDIGDVRSVVATVNDVHFGETECGRIDGSTPAQFFVEPGAPPYPEVMNASVIHDMGELSADAIIVKGDLTSEGTLEEYETFRRFYEPAFGDRLTVVRGNHDSYPGLHFADWPLQIVDVSGLRVILLDTSRDFEPSGFVSAEQIEATCEAARASTETVIVMGHHPLFVPHMDLNRHFDGVNAEDSDALINALAPLENVVAYTAGHTHRCRRAELAGLAVVEVACVKDYPGAWAEYLIGTKGIAQIVHRASGTEAVAWAEKTRQMFDGFYGSYAMGELADRCFSLPLAR